MTNNESQFSTEYSTWLQNRNVHGTEGFSPSFDQQPTNVVGPDYSIRISSGLPSGGARRSAGNDVQPALFDENKLEDGFGPVYAVPSFPTQPGFLPSTASGQGMPLSEQEHPPLYGQGQEHGGFGPIYAAPPFPFSHRQSTPAQPVPHPAWQQGQQQGAWGNQWQQGGYFFMPVYYPYRCVGSPFQQ